jgi:hypothetical protein
LICRRRTRTDQGVNYGSISRRTRQVREDDDVQFNRRRYRSFRQLKNVAITPSHSRMPRRHCMIDGFLDRGIYQHRGVGHVPAHGLDTFASLHGDTAGKVAALLRLYRGRDPFRGSPDDTKRQLTGPPSWGSLFTVGRLSFSVRTTPRETRRGDPRQLGYFDLGPRTLGRTRGVRWC